MTVRPVGAPVTATFTAPVKPLVRVRVSVALPVVPCCTLTAFDDNAMVKPGVVELNVASTLTGVLPDGVTVQVVAVPVQAPSQPAKALPALAAAVSVTFVPGMNPAPHVLPQLMPAGLEVIVPLPSGLRNVDPRSSDAEEKVHPNGVAIRAGGGDGESVFVGDCAIGRRNGQCARECGAAER